MARVAYHVLIVTAIAILPSSARAEIVTLMSSADLNNLKVGDQVKIDVNLGGLASGNFIFNLFTQVAFPSAQFQLVSGPTATKTFLPKSVFFGPDNIADPQLADFNAHSGAIGSGGVAGNFVDETVNGVGAIGQNGLYYSFILRATSAGSGSIGFDLTNPNANRYSGTSSSFAFAPLPTGPSLSFNITTAAIPEPSALVMAGTITLMGGGYWWRERTRAAA